MLVGIGAVVIVLLVLEAVGLELRQYIVTDNNEERPFSRDGPVVPAVRYRGRIGFTFHRM